MVRASAHAAYGSPVEWIRRVRIPVVVTAGIAYVVLLPWLGWQWAQSALLFATIAIFYWLPAIACFIRNFKAGYAENQ
jgi:hypothetical protein